MTLDHLTFHNDKLIPLKSMVIRTLLKEENQYSPLQISQSLTDYLDFYNPCSFGLT